MSGVDVDTSGGRRHCERSEATQGYVTRPLGCFVAPLLAMTKVSGRLSPPRKNGSKNGEGITRPRPPI